MIRFLDGPAAGEALYLRAAPPLLRVVRDPEGEFDALDQLGDTPAEDEAVFAYVRQGEVFAAHISYRSKGGRRGGDTVVNAQYRLAALQPSEACLRSEKLWRAWCETQCEKTGGVA